MNRNLLLWTVFGFSVFWISLMGSVVFCWVFSFVFWLWMVACPFLAWIIVVGEKPMNEYWASFLWFAIDSRKYAFL